MTPGTRGPLIAMVVLALAIRLVVVLATPGYVPRTDSADYDRHAVSLVDHGSYPASVVAPGGGPTALRPPLFPFALAAVYELVGTDSASLRWTAGRVLEAVLGTVVVALISLIALRVWGMPTALVAGAIAAVYPPLLLVGSSLMSEPLYIVLVLAAVLAALESRLRDRWPAWVALTGILLGLAALTRPAGLLLVVPLAVLVAGGSRRPQKRIAPPAALLAVALATVSPWVIRDASVFHAFVPISTEGGYLVGGTYNRVADSSSRYPALTVPPALALAAQHITGPLGEEQASSRLTSAGSRYERAHPAYVLKVAGWSTLRLLNLVGPGFERYLARLEAYPRGLTTVSIYAFWLLALLATAGAFTAAARRAPAGLWGCLAMLVLSVVLIAGATRYRAPADPFLVMLAAVGLLACWGRVRRSSIGALACTR